MSQQPRPSGEGSLLLLSLSISVAFLMETLDSTIIVPAIPAMAADFGVEPLRINLAISLYLVALAAMIPASGWLADRFGAKRIFLWAMAGFMVASIGAALSVSLEMLVGMRILQAVAGALMTPVGRLLLIRSVRKEELAAAIGWMSMPALVGPVLGPLVGGYIVTYASWPWIFLVKMPFGIAGLILAARMLPPDRPHPPGSFDVAGFVYCAACLGAAQLLLDQLVHVFLPVPAIATLFAAVPVMAVAFLWHSRRRQRPALDLTLLRLPLFRVGFFAGGLSRLGLNALPFLLQLQLQLGFGWSAARAGWIVFIVAAGALVFKPLMRRVLAAFGFRTTLSVNALLGGAIAAILASVGQQTPAVAIGVLVFGFGLCRSLQFNTVNTLLFAEIPSERQSASTALGGVGQQLSMGLGISVAAVLVAQFQNAGFTVPSQAMSSAMFVVAGLTAISGLLFLRLHPADGAVVSRHRIYIQKS